MRQTNKNRIAELENQMPAQDAPIMVIRIISCECQVKHPERFREIRDGDYIRLEPLTDDSCTCHKSQHIDLPNTQY